MVPYNPTHMKASGAGLDMVTAAFGPRYTWLPAQRRYSFFGQVLAGDASGRNSIFPTSAGFSLMPTVWPCMSAAGPTYA